MRLLDSSHGRYVIRLLPPSKKMKRMHSSRKGVTRRFDERIGCPAKRHTPSASSRRICLLFINTIILQLRYNAHILENAAILNTYKYMRVGARFNESVPILR